MRLRRALRLLAWTLAAIALLVALAAGAARAWLETDAGGRWLARSLLGRLNEGIAGDLQAASADVDGFAVVHLEGLRLVDANGELVAKARDGKVVVSVPGLLRGSRDIEHIVVRGLDLTIVREADGSTALVRALTPPRREPDPKAKPKRFDIAAIDATVERFEYVPAPGEPPSFTAVGGAIAGGVEVRGPVVTFDAEADLELAKPFAGPAQADLKGRYEAGVLELPELDARLPGGIRVEGSAVFGPGEAQGARAGEPDGVPPALLACVAPACQAPPRSMRLRLSMALPRDALVAYGGPKLTEPMRVTAFVSLGRRTTFDGTVFPPGPGSILAKGWYESGKPGRYEIELDTRGIDPAAITPAAPRGALWGTAKLAGALAFPPRADTTGTVTLGRSVLRGQRLGPGRAAITLKGARISARGLRLDVPGANVRGSIRAGGGAPDADLSFRVSDARRFGAAARAFGLGLPELDGRAQARLRVVDGDRELSLDVRSQDLTIAGTRLRDLLLDGALAGRALTLTGSAISEHGPVRLDARGERTGRRAIRLDALSAHLPDADWKLARRASIAWGARLRVKDFVAVGPGRLAADLDLPLGPRAAKGAIEVHLRLENVPFDLLSPVLPRAPRGTASARIDVAGTRDRPVATGHVNGRFVALAGERAASARVTFRADRRAVDANGWLELPDSGLVRLEASLDAAGRADLWTREGLLASMAKVRFVVPALELDALAALGLAPEGARGGVEAEIVAEGPLGKADVQARLQLTEVELVRPDARLTFPPISASLVVDSRERAVIARLEARMAGAPPVTAYARAGAPLQALVLGERPGDAPLSASLVVHRNPVDVRSLDLHATGVAVFARAWGTLARPQAEVDGRVDGLVFGERAVGAAELHALFAERGWEGALALAPADGGRLLARVVIPPGGGLRDWTASLEAQRAKLDFLEGFTRVRAANGLVADGRLELRPDGASVQVAGTLALAANRLVLGEVGAFDAVELALEGRGRELRVSRFAARAKNGRVALEGAFAWRDRLSLQLDLSAERFPVPVPARAVAELTTRAAVTLARDGRLVSGEVRLSPGSVRVPEAAPGELHPLALPPDFKVHRRRGVEGEEPPWWERQLAAHRAHVHVVVPPGFWVRTGTAELDLTADVTGEWDGRELAAVGEVRALRGHLTVLQRRFGVERLAFTFTGREVVDPGLDGLLRHQQPDMQIRVALSGTLRAPELDLFSDPPMDESDIALFLATGGGGGGGLGAGGLAGTAVAGALNFFAGRVGSALARSLPLDVLAFQLGPRGEARRIEAGAYITPNLFVAYARNLFATPEENTNEVRAEYQLGRRTSLRTRYGDRQAGGVNLLWEKRFRSKAQRRGAAGAGGD